MSRCSCCRWCRYRLITTHLLFQRKPRRETGLFFAFLLSGYIISHMENKKPMIETHGQEEAPKQQPTLLEQVWGYDGLERYGTGDEETYNKRLEDMNRPELEAHARMMGVVIVESSLRLKEKLLNEFRAYSASLHKPTLPSRTIPPSEAALKVMAEGR